MKQGEKGKSLLSFTTTRNAIVGAKNLLKGFTVKNIESESAEANDFNHILLKMGMLRK